MKQIVCFVKIDKITEIYYEAEFAVIKNIIKKHGV